MLFTGTIPNSCDVVVSNRKSADSISIIIAAASQRQAQRGVQAAADIAAQAHAAVGHTAAVGSSEEVPAAVTPASTEVELEGTELELFPRAVMSASDKKAHKAEQKAQASKRKDLADKYKQDLAFKTTFHHAILKLVFVHSPPIYGGNPFRALASTTIDSIVRSGPLKCSEREVLDKICGGQVIKCTFVPDIHTLCVEFVNKYL
jgi:hypothetical protein